MTAFDALVAFARTELSLPMRFFFLGVGVTVWAGLVFGVLALLSFLMRRNFLYEGTIRGFEEETLAPGSIVFVGSSTIRFWTTLERDFAPRKAVNRGFGGAVVSQALHFAPRILRDGADVRAVVLYCGGNDLAWGVSRASVVRGILDFVDVARAKCPRAEIFVCSIAKTPSRFLSWRRVDATNRELSERVPERGATFVDVTSALLGPNGRPKRSHFVFDGIHPSDEGYAAWTRVLRERFDADLGVD